MSSQNWEAFSPAHVFSSAGVQRVERYELKVVFTLYVLAMCAFALLHPVQEWPDAEVHLTEACQGEVAFPPKALLRTLGQDVCSLSFLRPMPEFRFFSDQTSVSDRHSFNPLWTYIFLPLVCLLGLFFLIAVSGNRDAVGNPITFAPPLAFYLSNVNIEIFGIFIVVSAYFIFRTRPGIALLLTCVATAIDRSHVCSFFTISLLYFFRSEARSALLPYFLVGVLALYVARLAGFLGILDVLALVFDYVPILGITGEDVLFNADYGARGYAALLASAAGLYGAMSYRPVLWIAYYGLFFMLLAIGWRQSAWQEKKVLLIAIAAALCVMIVLPPLSQARFFPVVIIAMWSMVLKGGRWFGVWPLTLQVFFFCWTMVTVVWSNLNHIAST